MKVNGQIPEIKDGCCNSPGKEETQPMYQNSHHSGQPHVHEEAPIDLLESLETENQFQVSHKILSGNIWRPTGQCVQEYSV